MAKKKPRKSKKKSTPMRIEVRVVAVHRDVTKQIERWAKSPRWIRTGGAVQAAIEELQEPRENDEANEHVERAEMALKQLFHKTVSEAKGDLRELGKNMRGGAPRVFLLRKFNSYFFVAADLEEGSGGCSAIPIAKQRAKEILKAGLQATLSAYQSALGTDYQVFLVPWKETRGA